MLRSSLIASGELSLTRFSGREEAPKRLSGAPAVAAEVASDDAELCLAALVLIANPIVRPTAAATRISAELTTSFIEIIGPLYAPAGFPSRPGARLLPKAQMTPSRSTAAPGPDPALPWPWQRV